MIDVALDAGLRKGELVGLELGGRRPRRQDEGRASQRVARADGRELCRRAQERARSKIPLTNRVVASLKAHRHLRAERIFCNDDGSELTPGQMEVALRTACRRAGLRQIGWHVLRHTFGSTLAQRGAAPKAIQELMGHSDMSTTMRYMHLAPAHHVEAVALLDERVFVGLREAGRA